MTAGSSKAAALALLAILSACRMGALAKSTPATVNAPDSAADKPIPLPNHKGSLKFAVIGDFGTGLKPEYQLAEQVWKTYQAFKFDLVILVGDNLYGGERPQDFKKKFETPFKPLLDDGLKFYASLGNHDSREQRYYKQFNMEGKLYYTLKASKQDVRFFALDSTYPVPEQIEWLKKELKDSNAAWKIPFFHHPLYSSGERHGSDVKLREVLEPLFVDHGVSVVFNGHDHFYERVKPQKGIVYFVAGSGGMLRAGNIDPRTGITAKGFDTDQAFMAVEIEKDHLWFQAISRTGAIIDSGVVERRKPAGKK